jgi:hypothetical protein
LVRVAAAWLRVDRRTDELRRIVEEPANDQIATALAERPRAG